MSFLTIWMLGLGTASVLVTTVWLLSLLRRDASIMDVFWGAGFAVLAWVYALVVPGWSARGLLVASLVTLWGVRLSIHILVRSHGKPEDYRYREMREKHGASFPVVSFFTVFLLQGLLLWLISAPLLQAIRAGDPPGLIWIDVLAAVIFTVGFVFEAVGDLQLARFRSDLANRGRVMKRGLWRYTRHPNYFGDAVVWWSFFLFALSTAGSLWTVYSPVLMTFLLLRVSGVSLLEKKLEITRPGYAEYVATTNAFVPWIPRTGERR